MQSHSVVYCTACTEMKGQNQKEKVLHIQKSINKIPTGFNPEFHVFYVYSPIQLQYQCASDKKQKQTTDPVEDYSISLLQSFTMFIQILDLIKVRKESKMTLTFCIAGSFNNINNTLHGFEETNH